MFESSLQGCSPDLCTVNSKTSEFLLFCLSDVVQALSARAGNQSIPKGGRGDGAGGLSLSPGLPETHQAPLPSSPVGSAVVRSTGAHGAFWGVGVA